MAGQAFQVTDALKDKKQQQDFSYSSALKTPIFTKRDRAQLILIFSAVIKVKGKPSLSYIPLVTPSDVSYRCDRCVPLRLIST
ncbi:hypothetical protein [Fischerella sp. FACHB-380]|uniref:hypothetical protein n=1 Tax=Fischerella sp. FACHB-380 TaxID=2692799 RepID=UPI001687FD66|nr:hypothetical protein [Fischerella sp. FACHB-380]